MLTRFLPLFLAPALALAAETVAKPVSKPTGDTAKAAPRRTLAQLAEDKRVLAAELVQLLRVEKLMADEIVGMRAGIDAQFDQALAGPAAAQRALIEEYRVKIHAIVGEGVDWKLMQADIVRAYADAYAEGELRELIVFFKSPLGRAFIEKSAQTTAAVRVVAQARLQQVQPRIQSAFYELGLRLNQAQQSAGQPAPSAR